MSLIDATECPFCSSSLEFVRANAYASIGYCNNCGGAPTHCLSCGSRASVEIQESMPCPSCGENTYGKCLVPIRHG
jgi:predicted RNA-binding Zn-ribbon protein involved in translation (DUF1610 family)